MSSVVVPGNLGPEFSIGGVIPSLITVQVDGTSVSRNGTTGVLSATQPAYDTVAKTLTFPAADGGTPLVIDLSSLASDIFVTGATLAAGVLTLTDNDAGTPDVVVDLSAFLGVSTDAGNVLTAGADDLPFLDAATVEALATNTCTDAFGVDIFSAFNP